MLNPELYSSLLHACKVGAVHGLGGGQVQIANEGERLQGHYVYDPINPQKQKLNLLSFGETYKVCCPWCGDLRHRLWISHGWGTFDPHTKSSNYHLYKCFNEDCTKQKGFFQDFRNRVNSHMNGIRVHGADALVTQMVQLARPEPVKLPDSLVDLCSLPADHPAQIFLKARKFSPAKLRDNFEVSWCEKSHMPLARHRLVVPIKTNGLMVGWQARYVDFKGEGNCADLYICQNKLCQYQWVHPGSKPRSCPNCNFVDMPPRAVPKWYTAYGTHVGQALLNYDIAQTYDFGVIMEGPFDVFRLGSPLKSQVAGPGMAVFNHKVTQHQMALLQSRWGRVGTIYLMFDDDVWDDTCQQLIQMEGMLGKGRVAVVPLGDGRDPDDIDHKELWSRIRQAGKAQGACCIPEEPVI